MITKKFYFKDISAYGEEKLETPEGYTFLQFIERNRGSEYSTTTAVFVMHEQIQEVVARLEEKSKKEIEAKKESLDKEFKERIGDMQLEQAFNDIISRFKIGDRIYHYKEWVSRGDDDKLEDHIDSFNLDSVWLERTQVTLTSGTDNYSPELILKGWNERVMPVKAFKTKEEALTGSQSYHDERMKKKKADLEKALKEAEEKKKIEDAEILKKAEEIKSKQGQ